MAWVNIYEFGTKYKHYTADIAMLIFDAEFSGKKSIEIDDDEFADMVKKDFEISEFHRKIAETARLNNIGMELEKDGDIDTAISVYEENIAMGSTATHSYDRLMILYHKAENFQNEKRVIEAALDVFSRENQRRAENSKLSYPENAEQINNALQSNSRVYSEAGQLLYNPYQLEKWNRRLTKNLKTTASQNK